MERKNGFSQEELVLADVFREPAKLVRKRLPDVFYNIKFNANLYKEANSNEKFVEKRLDFYLLFAQKGRLTSISKMLFDVVISKEYGAQYYELFMHWICLAWIIQAITGAKIFEIDNSGIDDTLCPCCEQNDSNHKYFLKALCQLGKEKF